MPIPRFLLRAFASSLAVSLAATAPGAIARRADPAVAEQATFVTFLNRYLRHPDAWTMKADNEKAVFERWVVGFAERSASSGAPASSAAGTSSSVRETRAQARRRLTLEKRMVRRYPSRAVSSSSSAAAATVSPVEKVRTLAGSFTILPFVAKDCTVSRIQESLEQKYPGALKDEDKAVGYERIPGDLASGFTWTDPGGGKKERHICIVPPNRINVAEVVIPASDADTYAFVRSTILIQLVKEVNRARVN